MKANDYFLNRTFFRYLFPTILSVLGGTVNVTVDSIIIGNVLGEDGLTAITLCTPIYLILCTIGSLVACGTSILASVSLGKSNGRQSRYYYTEAFVILIAASAVTTLAGIFFTDTISAGLGANPTTEALIADYLGITLIGSGAKILLYIPFYFLRLDGRNSKATACLLVMTAVNLGLDLLFMPVLGMGMSGAALASVIASALAAVLGFCFLAQKKSCFHFVGLSVKKLNFFRIAVMGSPTALFNLLSALRIITLNRILLTNGGQSLVTIFAVLCSLGEFSLCIINGIPQTASPLIGVYSGERDNRSVRVLMKRQLLTSLLLTGICAILIAFFSDKLYMLFGMTRVNGFSRYAMYCFAISLIPAGVNSILSYYFNTTGNVTLANIITIYRIFLFTAASALLLDVENVWLFYPVAELATLLLTLGMMLFKSTKKKNLSRFLLLDDEMEKSGKIICFSVNNDISQVVEASEKITDFCEANGFSQKQTMAVSLSIEEMLTVILSNCFSPDDNQTVDIRVFKLQDVIGLRLRNAGKEFNPVKYFEENADKPDMMTDLLGIKMITKLADCVLYQRTFGMNSLLILI